MKFLWIAALLFWAWPMAKAGSAASSKTRTCKRSAVRDPAVARGNAGSSATPTCRPHAGPASANTIHEPQTAGMTTVKRATTPSDVVTRSVNCSSGRIHTTSASPWQA